MSENNKIETHQLQLGDTSITVAVVERKRKNSDDVIRGLRPVVEPTAALNFLTDVLVKAGGNTPEQALQKIQEAIYRELVAGYAAESMENVFVAGTDPDTNEPTLTIDPDKYFANLAGQFEPASRRSTGPSMKDLKDRLQELTQQMQQYITIGENGQPDFPAHNTPEYLAWARLAVEQNEVLKTINTKEGARAGKPRKPRAKKAKATA